MEMERVEPHATVTTSTSIGRSADDAAAPQPSSTLSTESTGQHQRQSSEISDSDSVVTFVVNIDPAGEITPGGRQYTHVRNCSMTDNDTVPLTGADELHDSIEGWDLRKQGAMNWQGNSSGPAFSYIRQRAAQEWDLLCRQWRMYVTCITVNIYGGSMVFRNLAFYRYRAGERLTQDLGFDLLPEMKGWLTGLPMLLLQLTCLTACALSFLPRSSPAPYAVNIIRRCVCVCLRACVRACVCGIHVLHSGERGEGVTTRARVALTAVQKQQN